MFELLIGKKMKSITHTYGYFAGGGFSVVSSAIDKYGFSADTIVASGMVLSVPGSLFSAVGNKTTGYLISGYNRAYRVNKINYASSTTNSYNSVSNYRDVTAGASSKVAGYFTGAYTGGASITKINFAGDTFEGGQALLSYNRYSTSTGNEFFFVNAGDSDAKKQINKFTYATNVCVISNSLTGASTNNMASANNKEYGLFAGGSLSTKKTEKYIFASDTVMYGTDLGIARFCFSGIGNSEVAVFSGGTTNPSSNNTAGTLNSTERYTHATQTVAPGTNLLAAIQYHAGLSINPAVF